MKDEISQEHIGKARYIVGNKCDCNKFLGTRCNYCRMRDDISIALTEASNAGMRYVIKSVHGKVFGMTTDYAVANLMALELTTQYKESFNVIDTVKSVDDLTKKVSLIFGKTEK